MPIIDDKPKLKIEDKLPRFASTEYSEVTEADGFKTYDQAGATYDNAGFTYDGITGWSGNPPKL